MKKAILIFTLALLFFSLVGCADSNASSLDQTVHDLEAQLHWLQLENERLTNDIESLRSDSAENEWRTDGYAEELGSFMRGIADLMYDHEYDVVKTLLDYCPEGVEAALEVEFGVTDINTIIEYIETSY